MLGKSHIKWRQRPDMTIAVDWDVKHQFKVTIQTLFEYNIFTEKGYPFYLIFDIFVQGTTFWIS